MAGNIVEKEILKLLQIHNEIFENSVYRRGYVRNGDHLDCVVYNNVELAW